jgi:hypothetical protein
MRKNYPGKYNAAQLPRTSERVISLGFLSPATNGFRLIF